LLPFYLLDNPALALGGSIASRLREYFRLQQRDTEQQNSEH
jgi:hypothetical protein